MSPQTPNNQNSEKINKLVCYVLPGHQRYCMPEYQGLYNKAYEFWYINMGAEMRHEQLTDIDTKLSSDGFMLFEDIFVLGYINDKQELDVAGIFCFDTKDVTSSAILGQSSFKAYPRDIKEQYILPCQSIMTIGHLLVHPDWRRSQIGIGLSDILVWFMHKRFVESGTDLMIYFTRNNRGTNDLGKKFGGDAILEHYNYGGLDADIIATYAKNVVLDCGDENINQLSQKLWDGREYCYQPIAAAGKINSTNSSK